MQIGDSYFIDDGRGGMALILKDAITDTLIDAALNNGTSRIVLRKYSAWGKVDLNQLAGKISDFWIQVDDAPNETALPFSNLKSLHLVSPPSAGFLSRFTHLEECSLNNVTSITPDVLKLKSLRRLRLGDECKINDNVDFNNIINLAELVISGRSIPRGFSCFDCLKRLRFLGMSDWNGNDLSLLANVSTLEEAIFTSFKNATSLKGLDHSLSIRNLHLSSWPKLQDVSALSSLRKLRSLTLEDCPSINSLSMLFAHPSLERILLWGKTILRTAS